VVEAKRHLLAQKKKKRGNPLRDGDEIVAIETLQAAGFLRARGSGARSLSERVSDPENIAASDETAFVRFARNELDHFYDTAIDTVDFLGHVAGGVDQLIFVQVANMRQFAERLQFNGPKGRAKGEEIATGHVAGYSRSHAERGVKFCGSDFYVAETLAMRLARVKSKGGRLPV
jgi:hypothetical protein